MKKEMFSPAQLMLEINRMFMPKAEANRMRLLLRISPSVPSRVRGDSDRLKRLLTRIIDKTLESGGSGGLSVGLSYSAEHLMVEVSATGDQSLMGIVKEIFDSTLKTLELSKIQGAKGVFTAVIPAIALDVPPDESPGEAMVLRWLTADLEVSDLGEEVLCGIPQRLEMIQNHALNGNIKELKEAVHGFKGVAGNFHFDELYHLLKDMEESMVQPRCPREVIMNYVAQLHSLMGNIPPCYFVPGGAVHPLEDAEAPALTLLLAEDASENRILIRHFLKDLPVKILEAENGESAIRLLRENAVDVMLLDMQMPVLDGGMVLLALKEAESSVKPRIYIMTGDGSLRNSAVIQSCDCRGFIQKPVSKPYLRQLILREMGR